MGQASNILEDLARTRDGFSADQCPQKGLLAGIYNCSNEGEKKHSGMKKLMRQLGEDGFAPIADPTDVRARWLSEQQRTQHFYSGLLLWSIHPCRPVQFGSCVL